MIAAPARLGLLFALTLALPAAFAAAWVWLVPGGVIARAEADERRAGEQALAAASDLLQHELQEYAAALTVVLQIDAERHVVAPFAAIDEVSDPDPPVASVAEQVAVGRLAAGDVEGALPFFEHAVRDRSLTRQGWLRYVDAVAVSDRPKAVDMLAVASGLYLDTRCGSLPFAVLVLLSEARLSIDEDDWSRDHWREKFLSAMRAVPADVVAVVLDELASVTPGLVDERIVALRAAAAAARHYRAVAVPDGLAVGPDGSVIVPFDDTRCAVVPAVAVARSREEALAEVARREPGVRIVVDGTGVDEAPALAVPALAERWAALPATTPTSTLLSIAAHTILVLALATLVLGNLLLWRLTRRESQLVRLRADFVDVVSHELRTPLTALSLKAEMLAADDVPPQRRAHYLHGVHQDVRRLTDQVERILDFGRLQNGAPLRRELVPARALLAKALRQGRPALRLVAQQLEVDVPRALPAIVGDVDVLSRALRNLLENAAKYAPPGSPVAVRAFAQGGELVVEIADRGPGVRAGDRASIFQPFVRGSQASAATPGSGLGLALVAAAASSHGGRVTVHERSGGGAVFTLQLPARREEVG